MLKTISRSTAVSLRSYTARRAARTAAVRYKASLSPDETQKLRDEIVRLQGVLEASIAAAEAELSETVLIPEPDSEPDARELFVPRLDSEHLVPRGTPAPPVAVLEQSSPGFYHAETCDLADLEAYRTIASTTTPSYQFASEIVKEVVMYDSPLLPWHDHEAMQACQAEIADVLMNGSGIAVFRNAFDPGVTDAVTEAFWSLISAQGDNAKGDHFARAGANSRVWNAVEKLAVADPDAFVEYYSNSTLALASMAWLGPGYQMTAQVNVVHPGGDAQAPHRDYHLGFRSDAEAELYPAHVHEMCPTLTLQGAVAHCDMPLESGPTLFLPHSQKYKAGYLAWRREDFKADFAKNCVQLPLRKGDALFFNPAVFHAAGKNHSEDIHRMANLVQVNSAFGRAMETVDRTRMCKSIYPALREAKQSERFTPHMLSNVIAASAEGNPFPTNLDFDPPVGGLAPDSQATLLARCVDEGRCVEEMVRCLDEHQGRVRSH